MPGSNSLKFLLATTSPAASVSQLAIWRSNAINGLSRTALQTYLPAFFVAGALCVVAALIVLAIARPKPVAA